MDDNKLFQAVKLGDLDIVKIEISNGTAIESRDNNGWTPLIWACKQGQFDVGKYLVENGADIEGKSNYDLTPLMFTESIEIARFLVEPGADLKVVDDEGWTVFIKACSNGNLDIVKDLFSCGADIGSDPLKLKV